MIERKARGEGNPLKPGRIEEVLRYIDAKYVEDIDEDVLIESAISTILDQLDPHSNYIPADRLQQVNEQLTGNFVGVGIEFLMLEDTVTVITPLAGGPAATVGVQPGDQIMRIQDTVVSGVGIDNAELTRRFRGEKGSTAELAIRRGGRDELIRVDVVRDDIPLLSMEAAYLIDPATGYIKIGRFSATTFREFMEAAQKLERQGATHLVLDLRDNPGGYLTEATKILNQLIPKREQLLVYTQGREGERSTYNTVGPVQLGFDKVAVLIDDGSASASEIVAGAVQDLDRGVIVGRRSFGKGLVQEQYDLADGSALRLTVARYYTPSGRLIQRDYADTDEYARERNIRYESGELLYQDSIGVVDSTRYYTLNGRIVYGGGGVTPDVFVPIDTLLRSEAFLNVLQHLPQFAYSYANRNRAKFDNQSLSVFRKDFEVSDDLLRRFGTFAASKGSPIPAADLQQYDTEIRQRLRAFVARQLYGDEGYYAILNEDDQVVKAALETFEKTYRQLTSKQ